jgi:hypothetical protein
MVALQKKVANVLHREPTPQSTRTVAKVRLFFRGTGKRRAAGGKVHSDTAAAERTQRTDRGSVARVAAAASLACGLAVVSASGCELPFAVGDLGQRCARVGAKLASEAAGHDPREHEDAFGLGALARQSAPGHLHGASARHVAIPRRPTGSRKWLERLIAVPTVQRITPRKNAPGKRRRKNLAARGFRRRTQRDFLTPIPLARLTFTLVRNFHTRHLRRGATRVVSANAERTPTLSP